MVKIIKTIDKKQSQNSVNFYNSKFQKDKKRIIRLMDISSRHQLWKSVDLDTIKNDIDIIFPQNIKFLKNATKNDFMYNGSFHEAIAPILATAQCFGLMPVKGIKSKDVSKLSFSWKDYCTIYALFVMIVSVLYTGVVVYWVFSQPLVFEHVEPIIFNVSIVIIMYNFILLGRKWPKLMEKWDKIERQLPSQETQKQKSQLAYKLKMLSIVVMTLSLIEHLLSIIALCHYANYCPSKEDRDPIRNFFRGHLEPIFYLVNYSPWWAIIGKLINIYGTFAWTYMDLFVMIIGIGISSGFKRVNESLRKVKGKIVPEKFWSEHRLHYRNLCNLCNEIDDNISIITMVSFSNNLYFICLQLLKSLNKMPSFAHALYFWFSLIFLIGRTLAVSLYSAEIHDESNKPILVLRCVPRESWCNEVKRFSEEVSTDVVALTGMRFFHLTRKLVLSVAGTIVTYELVLIQFHEEDQLVSICELTL